MTASELKYNVEKRDSPNYFFNRKTMKFFGDTMKNYGVRETWIDTYSEPHVLVYELYRRHAVKHGLQDSAYFRKSDFTQVFKERKLTI